MGISRYIFGCVGITKNFRDSYTTCFEKFYCFLCIQFQIIGVIMLAAGLSFTNKDFFNLENGEKNAISII